MAKAPTRASQRRRDLREQLWPDSEDRIWRGADEKGWWPAPRVLPLLLHLTRDKEIVGAQDASQVYLELLSRDFGQSIVEIRDEDEHAYHAGYTSSRARRTWQERMRVLEKAGFIEVRAKGNRDYGLVLIVHPAHVIRELRRQGKVTDKWWSMLQQQLLDTGATVLEDPLTSGPVRMAEDGEPLHNAEAPPTTRVR